MRRPLSLIAVLCLLAFGGCGDDDETTPATEASDATGPEDASSGDFMTSEEFIDASIPDQVEEVKTIVGITPECEGVKANEDFQVGVAINAAQASPNTPLADIVADQCGG